MSKYKRWVVKAGSQLVCSGGPLLLRAWMQQLAILRKKHRVEVIWITSGAIASASDRTGFKRKMKQKLQEKQALSAIGQPLVMDQYNLALQATGLLGAQVLLTYGDLEEKVRFTNFKNTLETLLKWGVVPILNENDVMATEEIKFGDNDYLSARVAGCMRADRLVILTDVEGLYESDPKTHPNAKLVKKLSGVSPPLLNSIVRKPGSDRGTGGMYSKLKAAQYAIENGIETWLVKGDAPQALLQVASRQRIGTRIEVPAKVQN